MTGSFSIIQDDKTKRSWLRHEIDGEEVKVVECPKKDFPYLRLLVSLIRNSDDPSQVMEYVVQQIEEKDEPVWKKPLPPHIPGFFIPPEELDGLENED